MSCWEDDEIPFTAIFPHNFQKGTLLLIPNLLERKKEVEEKVNRKIEQKNRSKSYCKDFVSDR